MNIEIGRKRRKEQQAGKVEKVEVEDEEEEEQMEEEGKEKKIEEAGTQEQVNASLSASKIKSNKDTSLQAVGHSVWDGSTFIFNPPVLPYGVILFFLMCIL